MTRCPKCGCLVTMFSDELGWYHRCTDENCDYKEYELKPQNKS